MRERIIDITAVGMIIREENRNLKIGQLNINIYTLTKHTLIISGLRIHIHIKSKIQVSDLTNVVFKYLA